MYKTKFIYARRIPHEFQPQFITLDEFQPQTPFHSFPTHSLSETMGSRSRVTSQKGISGLEPKSSADSPLPRPKRVIKSLICAIESQGFVATSRSSRGKPREIKTDPLGLRPTHLLRNHNGNRIWRLRPCAGRYHWRGRPGIPPCAS